LLERWEEGRLAMSFFEMRHVIVQFGGLCAVCDFSIALSAGQLVGLIGPNGAGKTTVFNTITGFITPDEGDIFWQGENIRAYPAHRVTASGIARTFQNIRLFADMTVLENVMVSFHYSIQSDFLHAMVGSPKYRRVEAEIREKSRRYLYELGLGHLSSEKAATLAYGQQRRLEIARALATGPKLLLLDEPAAGMNPIETIELAALIRLIRDKYGVTVFLIEHDMKFVMGLCERIKVLDYGKSIAEGTPTEIQKDIKVIKAYLGSGYYAAG